MIGESSAMRAMVTVLVVAGLAASAAGQGSRSAGLTGVWTGLGNGATPGGLRNVPFPRTPAFTAAGAKQFKSVKVAEDPTTVRCWPPGPTRFMTSDRTPLEILDTGNGLAIITPKHYLARRIYTDGRAHPTDWDPPAYNGHSIGRWEGDTLVVETTLLNDKTWLADNGLPHSDGMRLVERLRLVENGAVLENQITVEDPLLYSKPLTAARYWVKAPNAPSPELDYSCMEKLKGKVVVAR